MKTVHYFHITNIEDEIKHRRLSLTTDISLIVLLLLTLYDTIVVISFYIFSLDLIPLSNTLSSLITIILYVVLLCVLYIAVSNFKKRNSKKYTDMIKNIEIEKIFNLGLFVNFIYFLVVAISDADEIYSVVALTSFGLYLGFATSIQELLEQDCLKKVIMCFFAPLKNSNNLWKNLLIIIAICMLAVLSLSIALALMTALTIILIILLRKISYSYFRRNFELDNSQNKVLILQIGQNFSLKDKTELMIENMGLVLDKKENENNLLYEYDSIIVLASGLKIKELSSYTSFINNKIRKNGYIYDPLSKGNKRRCYILGCFGITYFKTSKYHIEEYVKLLKN